MECVWNMNSSAFANFDSFFSFLSHLVLFQIYSIAIFHRVFRSPLLFFDKVFTSKTVFWSLVWLIFVCFGRSEQSSFFFSAVVCGHSFLAHSFYQFICLRQFYVSYPFVFFLAKTFFLFCYLSFGRLWLCEYEKEAPSTRCFLLQFWNFCIGLETVRMCRTDLTKCKWKSTIGKKEMKIGWVREGSIP